MFGVCLIRLCLLCHTRQQKGWHVHIIWKKQQGHQNHKQPKEKASDYLLVQSFQQLSKAGAAVISHRHHSSCLSTQKKLFFIVQNCTQSLHVMHTSLVLPASQRKKKANSIASIDVSQTEHNQATCLQKRAGMLCIMSIKNRTQQFENLIWKSREATFEEVKLRKAAAFTAALWLINAERGPKDHWIVSWAARWCGG